tara:strand:+ start:70 stop:369 length:300 start_codon:yes stop_codon:yes gene_type:complete
VDEKTIEVNLKECGFVNIVLIRKPQSRNIIKNWMPGSGAENFVVSADIQARKPSEKERMAAFLNDYVAKQEAKHGHGHGHGHGASPIPVVPKEEKKEEC